MLKRRIAAGLVVAFFFAFMLALSSGPLLLVMLAVMTSLALYEFYLIAENAGYRVYKATGIVLGIVWLCCEYFFPPPFASAVPQLSLFAVWNPALLSIAFFAIMVRTMFDCRAERAMESGAITCVGFIYLPVMLSYYIRIAQWEGVGGCIATRSGVFLAFFLSIVVKMSDTGAFASGTICSRTCGTHPMFPRISPKKSWEGLAGGIAAGMATGLVLYFLARRYSWGPVGIFWTQDGSLPLFGVLEAALLSLLLTVVGVFGDLIESMQKRSAGIKDSARFIPGIGGLLDVVDSLVFAPLTLYFFVLFLSAIKAR